MTLVIDTWVKSTLFVKLEPLLSSLACIQRIFICGRLQTYSNLNIIARALTGWLLIGSVRRLDLNARGRIFELLDVTPAAVRNQKNQQETVKRSEMRFKRDILIYQHISA